MKIELWWLQSQSVLKKYFGRYSRPLNWRHELCCWSLWRLLQCDCRSSLGAWSARREGGLRQLRWRWLESLLVVLPPLLSYPAYCSALLLFLATVFDLHLAARMHLWEEVIQHVPLRLPRPGWECCVSRRQIIPPGEVEHCGIYPLAVKLTLMCVSNHQDYLFMK